MKTVIHWFRKGLRIHDNPALTSAVERVLENPNETVLRPIFILDPGIPKWIHVGANRWRFLQESLSELNENLKIINSRLYVIRGNPIDELARICKEWNVTTITWEYDIEPFAVKRDLEVEKMAQKLGIEVVIQKSHTVYDGEEILRMNRGKAPLTYNSFLGLAAKCELSPPLDPPNKLPANGCKIKPDSEEKKNAHCYDVPTLSEMGVNQDELGPHKFPGGETEALLRMEAHLERTNYICTFEKPNTSPNSLEPSTTVLSPYLKFGCLSSRLFFKRLNEVTHGKKHSQPPVSLVGQLIWRELYYCAALSTPNFDKMKGNPICIQIPWGSNPEHLDAWRNGKTGYPFIDAVMRQLKQEGWIHHLARHAVACFLTRGDLWISWEEGMKVFEEYLLDADWALNAANWMWLSASAFFHQYFRVYSPIAFGKKTDKEGKYIKKYVPELKNYPAGIIYEPWKASAADQKKYGCIIGKDYPERIVDHEIARKKNLEKMNAAYKKNRENKAGSSQGTKKEENESEDDDDEEEEAPKRKSNAKVKSPPKKQSRKK
uniref:CSON011543 protein n=1 Tax=Culicoides sonorensis TaxID=179676 RepID=A0A336M3J7_CULSO